jgi:hypothetical protein
MLPHPDEVGLGVLRPGKLHLELGFPGFGPSEENFQYDRVSIVDLPVGRPGPIAEVNGRQGVVKDDDTCVVFFGVGNDPFRLSLSQIEGRVGAADMKQFTGGAGKAGGFA